MLGAEHQSGRSAAKQVFWSLTAIASLLGLAYSEQKPGDCG
jgi:hypothetical protein